MSLIVFIVGAFIVPMGAVALVAPSKMEQIGRMWGTLAAALGAALVWAGA